MHTKFATSAVGIRRCQIYRNTYYAPSMPDKNTSFYLHRHHGLSIQIFAKGILLHVHVINFPYIAVILVPKGLKLQISDFFLTEIFWFTNIGKSRGLLVVAASRYLLIGAIFGLYQPPDPPFWISASPFYISWICPCTLLSTEDSSTIDIKY